MQHSCAAYMLTVPDSSRSAFFHMSPNNQHLLLIIYLSSPWMALNLPGFYFDQEKNRYFPLNSKIVKPLGALNNVPESSAPTQPAVIIPQRNTRSRHALRVENGLASRSIHQQLRPVSIFKQSTNLSSRFIGVSVLSNALLDVTFNAPWDYIGVKLTSLAVGTSSIVPENHINCIANRYQIQIS